MVKTFTLLLALAADAGMSAAVAPRPNTAALAMTARLHRTASFVLFLIWLPALPVSSSHFNPHFIASGNLGPKGFEHKEPRCKLPRGHYEISRGFAP